MSGSSTILVVEDNPINRQLLKRRLRKRYARVETTASGQECLEYVALSPPDIILMDMSLPDLDGATTVRILRKRRYSKPIIAVTANALMEDRRRMIDAGCNDYRTKPIDFEGLIASMEEQLEK